MFKVEWSLYVPQSGHYMYRKVVTICTKTLPNSTFCPHRVFMCFVWISEQRSFCYTTLNYRFLKPRRSVFTAQYGVSLYIMKLNFGLERICMSPGSLCVSLFVGNIQGSKSSRFSSLIPLKPSGHYMYRTVTTICTTSLTFNSSTLCPHSIFMCFVRISEQTAIISLYSIN